jgi:hypothetical protein
MTDDCRECKQPLAKIDNRGPRLTGCIACTADDKKVRLSEEVPLSAELQTRERFASVSA